LAGQKLVNLLILNISWKKVWQINRFSQKVIIIVEIWMILVWRIKDNSPILPNFIPAKLSHYMIFPINTSGYAVMPNIYATI